MYVLICELGEREPEGSPAHGILDLKRHLDVDTDLACQKITAVLICSGAFLKALRPGLSGPSAQQIPETAVPSNSSTLQALSKHGGTTVQSPCPVNIC